MKDSSPQCKSQRMRCPRSSFYMSLLQFVHDSPFRPHFALCKMNVSQSPVVGHVVRLKKVTTGSVLSSPQFIPSVLPFPPPAMHIPFMLWDTIHMGKRTSWGFQRSSILKCLEDWRGARFSDFDPTQWQPEGPRVLRREQRGRKEGGQWEDGSGEEDRLDASLRLTFLDRKLTPCR